MYRIMAIIEPQTVSFVSLRAFNLSEEEWMKLYKQGSHTLGNSFHYLDRIMDLPSEIGERILKENPNLTMETLIDLEV